MQSDDLESLMANACLTAKQKEVIRQRNQGFGSRKGARLLGITSASWQARQRLAETKMRRYLLGRMQ